MEFPLIWNARKTFFGEIRVMGYAMALKIENAEIIWNMFMPGAVSLEAMIKYQNNIRIH